MTLYRLSRFSNTNHYIKHNVEINRDINNERLSNKIKAESMRFSFYFIQVRMHLYIVDSIFHVFRLVIHDFLVQ